METVINSEIPEAEKNAFVDALLRTSNFDENIIYDRPPYAGGSYSQREKGIRITLPTGASMRIDATSNQLKADSDRQTYYIQESDVVFIMALVERGRLPPEALNSVYRVTISETNVSLSESLLRRGLSIDMTQPFDKTINFSPLYLSLLLTRDPRISESDRQRLRQYFGNNINLEVRKKSPHNVA